MSNKHLRTYVYIDGFNLYYRALKGTQYKWLDIEKLCFSLAPDSEIVRIKYFTARIKAKTNSNDASIRQDIYFKALDSECNLYQKIEGRYQVTQKKRELSKDLSCHQNSSCTPYKMKDLVQVYEPQEKQTDVNIAAHMINDAWLGLYDQAILISNDSDLAMALEIVRTEYPGKPKKRIGLITPGRDSRPAGSLNRHSDWQKNIKIFHLEKSQLPNKIADNIRKPVSWDYHSHSKFMETLN